MKIKADGRGRISLGQLGALYGQVERFAGAPHQTYDVTWNDAGEVTLSPPDGHEKSEPRWHPVDALKPELIGHVIGASMANYYVLPDSDSPTGVFGTLEGYSTDENGEIIDFKMQGMEGVVIYKLKESGLRLNYFWVKY